MTRLLEPISVLHPQGKTGSDCQKDLDGYTQFGTMAPTTTWNGRGNGLEIKIFQLLHGGEFHIKEIATDMSASGPTTTGFIRALLPHLDASSLEDLQGAPAILVL